MKFAYISNQYGFSETGRYLLDNLFYPKFREMGIAILDPFVECSKHLDMDIVINPRKYTYAQVEDHWKAFNEKVTFINNDLMCDSNLMIALLDGGPATDDGVSSELGYYYAQFNGANPIFALRSDFRLADNMQSNINVQLLGYITGSGGKLDKTINDHFKSLDDWMKKVPV